MVLTVFERKMCLRGFSTVGVNTGVRLGSMVVGVSPCSSSSITVSVSVMVSSLGTHTDVWSGQGLKINK